MSKKPDLQQVNAVAREFNMTPEQRKIFGDFIEQEKKSGNGGTKNERGDFIYQELIQKAQEFLGLNERFSR